MWHTVHPDDIGVFCNESINDNVKSYILGLVLTDGCIRKNGNAKTICVSLKDKYMIDMIHDISCPTKKVYKDGNNYQVIWKNAKDIEYLSGFNIAERKTYTIRLPNIENMSHLMRGIFDGDGSVFISTTHDVRFDRYYSYLYVSITSGSKQFLLDIQSVLSSIGVSSRLRIDNRHNQTYQLRITKQKDVNVFMNYIYEDANEWKLIRKYEKFLCVI